MTKSRLEAFSDGVLAIIITIMVLELRPPHEGGLEALRPLLPKIIAYVGSFAFIGIYWNNHHHMLQGVKQIDGRVLWANLHLLFWLSVIPFGTAWMGESNFSSASVTLHSVILFFAGFAYFLLTKSLIRAEGSDSILARAVGGNYKEYASVTIYLCCIVIALFFPLVAFALQNVVAVLWFIPDRRIERHLTN